MFKKFINEVAKSIKEEVKEEFGIKDRKDVFKELKEGAKEVDDIKNYLKFRIFCLYKQKNLLY